MSVEEVISRHSRKIAAGGMGTIGLIVLVLIGCPSAETHSNTESLEGTITSGGKPVRWGTVTVVGSDQKSYSARIQSDGTYRITGLPPGPVRIAVNSANPNRRIGTTASPTAPGKSSRLKVSGGAPALEGKQAFAKSAEAPQTTAPKVEVEWFPIPTKYANPGTSGLTTTTGSGTGPFNIQVD